VGHVNIMSKRIIWGLRDPLLKFWYCRCKDMISLDTTEK